MAINVQWDLNPIGLAYANYAVGQQQYAQRSQAVDAEEQRRQAAIQAQAKDQAAQAAQQQANEAARIKLQRDVATQQALDQQTRLGYAQRSELINSGSHNAANDNALYAQLAGHLLHLKQQQDAASQQAGNADGRQDAINQRLDQREQSQWAMKGAADVDSQLKAVQVQMSKMGQQLTPEGKRLWGGLVGKLRGIQAQQGTLPPEAYTQLGGQWLKEFNDSGVAEHVQPPPDPAKQWAETSVHLGDGRYIAFDAKGTPHQFMPPKDGEARDTAMAQRQERRDDDNHEYQGLLANHKAELNVWNAQVPSPTDFKKPGPKGADGSPGSEVTDTDAYMKARKEWLGQAPKVPSWRDFKAQRTQQDGVQPSDQGGQDTAMSGESAGLAQQPDPQQASAPLPPQPKVYATPSDLAADIKSHKLRVGDWVQTPLGPRQLTAAAIAKLTE